ncbi:MAG: methylenetetrahydrofolate reductase [NAD(P)H] [Planctomycetaceae bacterium]
MYLPEILKQRKPALSIEIFPPKTSKGDEALITHLERLAAFQPAFVSCTYGAGGSTRTRTVELCQMIQQRFSLPATAHFTCVGSTREELIEWLEYAVQAGVKNIMALRGDAPEGQEEFKRVEGGLGYANELVELIRKHQPQMGIGVAGYPEKHNEAPDMTTDLDNLKRKVDAGADAVFTQLFFDNQSFFTFQDECRSRGIEIPIVPGIMPITEFARIKRITSMCGAKMPAELAARLEVVQDDAEAQFEIGVEHAIAQCSELLNAGVPGIHFYALNKSEACDRILEALGVVPQR